THAANKSNVTENTVEYAHSLHDALPICEGTGWMEKILKNIEYGKGKMSDIDLLWDIQRRIEGNTICPLGDAAAWPVAAAIRHFRSEEHTSELQSRENLVCRLLLEKQNNN